MADDSIVEEIAAGEGILPLLKATWDAQTLQVDGIQGAMLGPQLCKMHLVEHFTTDEGLKARVVLNLVVPASQVRPMGEALIQMADLLDNAGAANGQDD